MHGGLAQQAALVRYHQSHLFLRCEDVWTSRQGHVHAYRCGDRIRSHCRLGDFLDGEEASQEESEGQVLWDGS